MKSYQSMTNEELVVELQDRGGVLRNTPTRAMMLELLYQEDQFCKEYDNERKYIKRNDWLKQKR